MLSPGNEVVPLSVVQERSLSGLVIMTESWGSAPSHFTSLWSHITAWCLLLVSNSSRIRVRDLNQPLTFRVEESIALWSDQMQGSITVAKDTRVCAQMCLFLSLSSSRLFIPAALRLSPDVSSRSASCFGGRCIRECWNSRLVEEMLGIMAHSQREREWSTPANIRQELFQSKHTWWEALNPRRTMFTAVSPGYGVNLITPLEVLRMNVFFMCWFCLNEN